MPIGNVFLVKNSQQLACRRCTGIHEFITRLSEDARCEVPVAFSAQEAARVATKAGGTMADVVTMPDDGSGQPITVVLDDSARKLPHYKGPAMLAQFTVLERMA